MPAPSTLDFSLVRGAAKTIRLTVTRNGSPVDLSNYTGANRRGAIKTSRQSTTTIGSFTFSEETPPGTDGILLATIPASVSALLDCDAVYDVEIENDGDPDEVLALATGRILVLQTTNEAPPP